jgi:hypothetical protein
MLSLSTPITVCESSVVFISGHQQNSIMMLMRHVDLEGLVAALYTFVKSKDRKATQTLIKFISV